MPKKKNMMPMVSLRIKRIVVDGLFGHFNYDLSLEKTSNDIEESQQLFILYGDNGSGKTTILNLVFHLLSPEESQGHRTYLARKQFRKLSVKLNNGAEITALRDKESIVGSYNFIIKEPSKPKLQVYLEADADNSIRVPTDKEEDKQYKNVLSRLSSFGLAIRFLSDIRKTSDDDEQINEESGELISVSSQGLDLESILRRRRREKSDDSLSRVINRLVTWINRQAIVWSNIGTANANTIYADIVKRISASRQKTAPYSKSDASELITTLLEQEKCLNEFSRFGLVSPAPMQEIIKVIKSADRASLPIILSVIKPYSESIQARLRALQSIYDSIQAFVNNLNQFYTFKQVELNTQHGLLIKDFSGEILDPVLLSSGERQLLLLFCNTLISQSQARVIIVDEPELSLNVKWQRNLVRALLECAQGGNVQFIFATHSLELLARHRNSVVKLENKQRK